MDLLSIGLNITGIKKEEGLYEKYLSMKLDKKNERLIKNDVYRSYPNNKYFKKNNLGQKLLKNVLHVWCIYEKEIGYVQGLNFIVGYILLMGYSEEETFWILICLMKGEKKYEIVNNNYKLLLNSNKNYGIMDFYNKNLDGVWIFAYKLINAINLKCPKLINHLINNKIDILVWLPQWIMTLFTKYVEFPKLNNFFLILIKNGKKVLLEIILTILILTKDKIFKLNSNDIIIYLNPINNKNINIWNDISIDIVLNNLIKIENVYLDKWEVSYNKKISNGIKENKIIDKEQIKIMDDYRRKKTIENITIGTSIAGSSLLILSSIVTGIAIHKKMINNKN